MYRTLFFAFLFLALFSPLVTAQEKASAIKPENESSSFLDMRLNIEFPGGNLSELLKVFEGKLGMKPNVIVSEEANALVIPPFSLSMVSVRDTIMSLQRIDFPGDIFLDIYQSANIMTVTAKSRRGQGIQKTIKRVQVFDVKDLIKQDCTIDDIVTAIRTGFEMLSEDHHARVKYHPETKLLIGVGSLGELGVIENVLVELQKGRKRMNDQKDLETLQSKLKSMQQRIKQLEEENNTLRIQLLSMEEREELNVENVKLKMQLMELKEKQKKKQKSH